jgi:hypothetical protein
MSKVKAQFQDAWLHNTRCPKVRTIYKLVNTRANLAKYERYLSVSSEIANSFTVVDVYYTETESKSKGTLPHRASPAETNVADGMELQESAILETEG